MNKLQIHKRQFTGDFELIEICSTPSIVRTWNYFWNFKSDIPNMNW